MLPRLSYLPATKPPRFFAGIQSVGMAGHTLQRARPRFRLNLSDISLRQVLASLVQSRHQNGGVVNKERFLPRAAGAAAIVALVLVTNECYRHVRDLLDTVNRSKADIALLKRDLYVLQVQLDNRPVSSPPVVDGAAPGAPAAFVAPAAPRFMPMPEPIGPALPLPEARPAARPKPQSSDKSKSLVSVVLMSDAKPTAAAVGAGAKQPDTAKVDVQLIGDAK